LPESDFYSLPKAGERQARLARHFALYFFRVDVAGLPADTAQAKETPTTAAQKPRVAKANAKAIKMTRPAKKAAKGAKPVRAQAYDFGGVNLNADLLGIGERQRRLDDFEHGIWTQYQ